MNIMSMFLKWLLFQKYVLRIQIILGFSFLYVFAIE